MSRRLLARATAEDARTMLPVYRSAVCAAAIALAAAACGSSPGSPTMATPPNGGGSTGGGTPPSGGPPAGTTITVTAAGVSPALLTVPIGTRVTFTNLDTRPHDFSGGPDPAHPECPEIDQAGFVAAGQSKDTGSFTTARTCQYHDHTFIGVPAFQGRIVIQ